MRERHAHLLHHAAAMNLDGLLDGAEIVGDLFVETSSNHMPKHLVWTGTSGSVAKSCRVEFLPYATCEAPEVYMECHSTWQLTH